MMKRLAHHYGSRESGASMTEYALLVVLIAFVVFAVLTAMGGQLLAAFQAFVDAFGSVVGGGGEGG